MAMTETPSANNCLIGAGELFFARVNASGVEDDGLRHLGNVEKIEVTPSVTKLEKKSSMDGAHGVYDSVVTETVAEIAITCSEFHAKNIAMGLLGDTAAFTQSADPAISGASINGGVAIVLNRWYSLGKQQVTVTAVEQGATPLVLGTDYILKADAGMIKFLSGGVATAAITTWDGSCAAITAKTKVRMLATPDIEGRLYFYPATNQHGPRFIANWWKVKFTPDGALGLISEEFASLPLKGTVLKDTTQAVGEEYGTLIEL
jgi:hypothetical protein